MVHLVERNNVTHASERQHGGDDDYLKDYLVSPLQR